MDRFRIIDKAIGLALILAGMVSCNEKEADIPDSWSPEEGGMLEISLEISRNTQNRALQIPFTQTFPHEKEIQDLQLLIFNEKGLLERHFSFTDISSQIRLETMSGKKTVWAFANCGDLSGIKNLTALEKEKFFLKDNDFTCGHSLKMYGYGACTVSPGSQTAIRISLERMVSRIVLRSIRNLLPEEYGTVTVMNAYLTNVAGECSPALYRSGGIWKCDRWHNLSGRMDGASDANQIIDGSSFMAAVPGLTWKSIEFQLGNGGIFAPQSPLLFYTFPNRAQADRIGWIPGAQPGKTRLVVTMAVGKTDYHYPITLELPESNQSLTVDITIRNLGTADPDIPVKADITDLTVSTDSWTDGPDYSEHL